MVISLLPGPDNSSASQGLRYQVYKERLVEITGLSGDALLGVVPAQHDHWQYEEGWEEGFQGFIVSGEEIDRLAAALST